MEIQGLKLDARAVSDILPVLKCSNSQKEYAEVVLGQHLDYRLRHKAMATLRGKIDAK
jgi:hypothetical protein